MRLIALYLWLAHLLFLETTVCLILVSVGDLQAILNLLEASNVVDNDRTKEKYGHLSLSVGLDDYFGI